MNNKSRKVKRQRKKPKSRDFRSSPNPGAHKFNRCTLNVRDLPLERFRLQRDGRKWRQAGRSRSDLLSRLATYANPDGTFEREGKNFSPSEKRLLQHYANNTLYRLSNELRELGLLSWDREKHYSRRIYKIHLQPEKQVPHSQNQVSDSGEKHLPHSQEHLSHSKKNTYRIRKNTYPPREVISPTVHGRCYHLPHSPESKQNTGVADSSSTSLRLLESLPSLGLPSVLEKEKGSGVAVRSSENGNSNHPVNPPSQKQNQKLVRVDSWGTRLADQGDDDE